jgi:hypothetical protein
VLPTVWQERLVPLTDEHGSLHAYCLEVHDTSVSKLMAGREKDFAFIKELLDRGLVEMETLISRMELIIGMPQSNALLPRLEKLETYLRGASRPRSKSPSATAGAPQITQAAKLKKPSAHRIQI